MDPNSDHRELEVTDFVFFSCTVLFVIFPQRLCKAYRPPWWKEMKPVTAPSQLVIFLRLFCAVHILPLVNPIFDDSRAVEQRLVLLAFSLNVTGGICQ